MSDKDLFLQYINKKPIPDKDSGQGVGKQRSSSSVKSKYDKTIDLHGLRQAEAKSILMNEIESAKRTGKKRLLVIHGRGNNSEPDKKGVLKSMTVEYLTEICGNMIEGFSSAPAADGGDGATVVRI